MEVFLCAPTAPQPFSRSGCYGGGDVRDSPGIESIMNPAPTERLWFRTFTRADIDLLVELDSDPEVMRWLTSGKGTPRDTYENEVLPRWERLYGPGGQHPGHGFFAVFSREEPGRFVGWYHLRAGYHWPDQMELGYRFRREFWGRGLCTEGARRMIEHAFRELNEPLVFASTLRANMASRRVMEKAGMEFECEFEEERWQGEDKRAVKYSIKRVG